ncbi:MAG TPA: glycosyltransferase [Acidimicrobiia bacterium]
MIPRIFHRVVPEVVPARFEAFWERFQELHPGWEFTTWRDPLDATDWELGFLHERCTAGAQLAGLVRLEVIWRHGGVYVDMDTEPLRSFEPLLDNECFFGTEDGTILTDAIFGAVAGHRGIRACIDRFLNGFWHPNPSNTGPRHTTDVLSGRPDVTVLPKDAFYPYLWTEPHRAGEEFPNSYALHRWNHSWKDWGQ